MAAVTGQSKAARPWRPRPEHMQQAWLTLLEGYPLPAFWWRLLGERLRALRGR